MGVKKSNVQTLYNVETFHGTSLQILEIMERLYKY
jgi:hypothetical protein